MRLDTLYPYTWRDVYMLVARGLNHSGNNIEYLDIRVVNYLKRNLSLLSWLDYDVDVGIHKADITKTNTLVDRCC